MSKLINYKIHLVLYTVIYGFTCAHDPEFESMLQSFKKETSWQENCTDEEITAYQNASKKYKKLVCILDNFDQGLCQIINAVNKAGNKKHFTVNVQNKTLTLIKSSIPHTLLLENNFNATFKPASELKKDLIDLTVLRDRIETCYLAANPEVSFFLNPYKKNLFFLIDCLIGFQKKYDFSNTQDFNTYLKKITCNFLRLLKTGYCIHRVRFPTSKIDNLLMDYSHKLSFMQLYWLFECNVHDIIDCKDFVNLYIYETNN